LCDQQTGKNQPPIPSRLESSSGHATGKNIVCHPRKEVALKMGAPIKTAVLLFNLIFVLGFGVFAQDSSPSEYQIKAAFLYNFAKFVQWPSQVFSGPTSPIVIGVLGKNVFGGDLEKTIHDKVINGHPLQFKKFDLVTEATNCEILFISPSEKNHLPKILKGLRDANVLTVSETDHFTEDGGMINFVIEDNRIHFQINNDAAKKAGLTISSKLLNLAIHNH
jgi:YfiR/HmsC-like